MNVPKPNREITEEENVFLNWAQQSSGVLVDTIINTVNSPNQLSIWSWNATGAALPALRPTGQELDIFNCFTRNNMFDIIALQGVNKNQSKIWSSRLAKIVDDNGYAPYDPNYISWNGGEGSRCGPRALEHERLSTTFTFFKKELIPYITHHEFHHTKDEPEYEIYKINHPSLGYITFVNVYIRHNTSFSYNVEDTRTIMCGDFNSPYSFTSDLVSMGDFKQTFLNGNSIDVINDRYPNTGGMTWTPDYYDIGIGDYTTPRSRLDHFLVNPEYVDKYIYSVDYRIPVNHWWGRSAHRPIFFIVK